MSCYACELAELATNWHTFNVLLKDFIVIVTVRCEIDSGVRIENSFIGAITLLNH